MPQGKLMGRTYCLAFLAICAGGAQAQEPAPRLADVEARAIEARKKILSAHLRLTTLSVIGEQRASRSCEVMLDGAKRRCDRLIRMPAEGGPEDEHREIACFGCVGADLYAFYMERTDPKAKPIALVVESADTDDKRVADIPVIRMFGMSPVPVFSLHRYHLESYLANAERRDLAMERAPLDGRDCWRIRYRLERSTPNTVQIWIDPEQGDSVVRIEQEYASAKHKYREFVASQYALDADSQLWFPKKCSFSSERDGVALRSEEATIEIVSLNKPLAPELFRLSSIPAGTEVMWNADTPPPSDFALEWTGKEIVSSESLVPQPTKKFPAAAVAAVMLAAVAGFAVWRFLKAPKTAT